MENNKITRLRFREINRNLFEAVRTGEKKIETRAATAKFLRIKKGDSARLVCGKDKFNRKINQAKHFKTISEMLIVYKVKEIDPFSKSAKELRKMYYSFPVYL